MDPISIEHFRRTKTLLLLRVKSGGDPMDLTSLGTVVAGIESAKSTASSSAAFVRFRCTAHGTSGTLSATIPSHGLNFTGPATFRVWASGTKNFLGRPIPVSVRDLSSNWLA